ncbi:hypothetical protein V8F33_006168 [Rhypophila sp. PSN 637]
MKARLSEPKHWLESAPASETDAVIYSEVNDDLSVLARDGTVDSFLTSPFISNTERGLVFLDQAHTRGTDLRLPDWYRAAVILGSAITKGTLVQVTASPSSTCLSGPSRKRGRKRFAVSLSGKIKVSDMCTKKQFGVA